MDFNTETIHLGRQLQRRYGELYEDTTKRRKRPMPLPYVCLVALRWQRLRWLTLRERAGVNWIENDYVFVTRSGRPVEPRALYRTFTGLAAKAGLRTVRLHDAQHGFATLMADAGVEPRLLMELMSRSEIGVTMNVYTHVIVKSKREAIKIMVELLQTPRRKIPPR